MANAADRVQQLVAEAAVRIVGEHVAATGIGERQAVSRVFLTQT